jgi:hypothetical protein
LSLGIQIFQYKFLILRLLSYFFRRFTDDITRPAFFLCIIGDESSLSLPFRFSPTGFFIVNLTPLPDIGSVLLPSESDDKRRHFTLNSSFLLSDGNTTLIEFIMMLFEGGLEI